jgi:hypothetical protein
MIAALFVQRGGVYYGRDNVDPWDKKRDARNYEGNYPVVAHPPCGRWCKLAKVNQARWGAKVGDDGGCFAFALSSVRKWGGVLEHPSSSLAWKEFDLIEPVRGAWSRCIDGGFVTEVSQTPYGHPARKLTWLYYFGTSLPPRLDWSLAEPSAQCGHKAGHANRRVLGKKEASATPPAFADVLIQIAESSIK